MIPTRQNLTAYTNYQHKKSREKFVDSARGPEHIPLISYLIALALAGWGGIAHYLKRLKESPASVFTFAELIGELAISSFAGIMIFLLCEWLMADRLLSAAAAGIAGHMGSKAIYYLEVWFSQQKFFGGK